MKKRLFSVILVICMLLSACGTKENERAMENEVMSEESVAEQEKEIEEVMEKGEDEKEVVSLEEEGFPIITIRLLLANDMEPQMSLLLQKDAEITESANQYLRDNQKEYRVQYETIHMKEKEPTAEELAGADILCTRVSPEEADLYYMNIAEELTAGKLREVYQSVPELYWDRVNVNGSIYSLLATPPVVQMIQMSNTKELSGADLDVPEEAIGQGIKSWEEYVEKVYTSLDSVGYIAPVGYSDLENPILASNAWNAKFQLVLPFLGIDCDNPELGVQCIYESEYAKEMQELWGSWHKRGYFASADQEWKWMIGLGYDVNVKETEYGEVQYPMQEVAYVTPQVAEVTYYATGISKGCEQTELVYQFLTEITMDDTLHEAMTMVRGDEEILWFHLVPKTLLVENNGQAIYFGSLEENIQLQEERFASAVKAPVPGFVMDTEPVQEEVDILMKILSAQNYYAQLSAMEVSGVVPEYAVEIHYIPQEIIDALYEQGLQLVLDEANRQLAEYWNP